MIIMKSISRFARSILDCLNFVRLLKDLGIGVVFERKTYLRWIARERCYFPFQAYSRKTKVAQSLKIQHGEYAGGLSKVSFIKITLNFNFYYAL